MEDDEETLKVSLQEVDDSRMEHKPLETEELTNTEQCEPVPELDDSQLVAAKLPIATKDDQAVVEEVEIPEAGTEIETGTESEDAEGGGQQSIPESDDLQLVGAESPIVAKDYEDVEAVAEDENQTADTEMETEAEAAKGSGGNSVPLFDDARFVGAESSIAAKDDEDDEAVAEEENPDTEIETETESEVAKGSGGESIPELEDAHLVGAESPIIAKDDDDEEVVAEDEIQMVDTKMEIEDAVEMAEAEKGDGGGGGKRKRGRISRVPSKAPARKAIGDDVCFICFDGGELVLCDRRGCPKAYHPSCVNRDEAFFRAKGRWNCGFEVHKQNYGSGLVSRNREFHWRTCPAHNFKIGKLVKVVACPSLGV
uniref:Zinc finger PHD-type domain-containing protein n=1 Tax=Davidia involucrata TaxID=16924 RepID=A0A5B7B8G7_DAVIN